MNKNKIKILILVLVSIVPSVHMNYGQDASTLIPFLERINATNLKQLREQLRQERILADLSGSQKQLLAVEKRLMAAQSNGERIAQLASYRKLYKIIGNMACTIRNLEAVLEISGQLSDNCIFNFDYDLALARYQFAMDGIKTVVGVGVLMSTSESMKTINDVNKALEDANRRLNRLTAIISGNVIQRSMNSLSRVKAKEDLTAVGYTRMDSPLN